MSLLKVQWAERVKDEPFPFLPNHKEVGERVEYLSWLADLAGFDLKSPETFDKVFGVTNPDKLMEIASQDPERLVLGTSAQTAEEAASEQEVTGVQSPPPKKVVFIVRETGDPKTGEETDQDQELEELKEVEDQYFTPIKQQPAQVSFNPRQHYSSPDIKIDMKKFPRISQFTGDILLFPQFYEAFINLVDMTTEISTTKLMFLKEKLGGNPLKMVQSYTTHRGYKKALTELYNEYLNPSKLMPHIRNLVEELPEMHYATEVDLFDDLVCTLRSITTIVEDYQLESIKVMTMII